MEVAVLGGGHGAHATAADLTEAGHAVRLWRRDARRLEPLVRDPRLELLDVGGTRAVRLHLVTADLAEALDGAELVVAPLPAPAQADLARVLGPHLSDGQVLFIPPGSFGSWVMARTLAREGCTAEVTLAESGTLPYLARMRGGGRVAISARATRLPTGAFPAARSQDALAVVRRAYPAVEPVRDALDAALLNGGPMIHPPLILMNAGPIEGLDAFDIHDEGTQPAVRRVHDALDAERVAVREALGYGPPHFPLRDHYEAGGEEWMYGNVAHERLVDSSDWREPLDLMTHRYMREDVACGLALLVSIADWCRVATPVAGGLLALASAVVGEDLRARGRTLEALGLSGLDRAALDALLVHGAATEVA
jgi:opine dehydrogenase